MTYEVMKSQCYWCDETFRGREFYPACSQDHLDKHLHQFISEGYHLVREGKSVLDGKKKRGFEKMMEKVRCHWCGKSYATKEFYPTCSQDHLDELRGDKVSNIPSSPPTAKEAKLKLWVKFINHQYAAWSALFELITGFKPPRMKDVAAIISGH